jgi:hypothetical protein
MQTKREDGKTVTLKNSKPIKFYLGNRLRFYARNFNVDDLEKSNLFNHSEKIKIRQIIKEDKEREKKTNGSNKTEDHIHLIRFWFLFLKLALELQSQNASIVVTKNNIKKIIVDENKYHGWDLEHVSKNKFDTWFESHKHLFISKSTEVISPNTTIPDDNNLYIKIDLSRSRKNINEDLKLILSSQKTGNISSCCKVNGKPNITTMRNWYNSLIIKIVNDSIPDNRKRTDRDIMIADWEYILPTTARNLTGYARGSDQIEYERLRREKKYTDRSVGGKRGNKLSKTPNYSRDMSGLVTNAKKVLLSVCDGYFPKS